MDAPDLAGRPLLALALAVALDHGCCSGDAAKVMWPKLLEDTRLGGERERDRGRDVERERE